MNFKSYAADRDIEVYVEDAFATLRQKHINPSIFFEGIIVNPKLLEMEPEDAVDDLIEWAGDDLMEALSPTGIGRGIKAVYGSLGSTARTKNLLDQWRYLYNLYANDKPKFDQMGYTVNHLNQLEKQYNAELEVSKQGWWQTLKGGYRQGEAEAKAAREKAAEDARHAQLRKTLGIGAPAAPGMPFPITQGQQAGTPSQQGTDTVTSPAYGDHEINMGQQGEEDIPSVLPAEEPAAAGPTKEKMAATNVGQQLTPPQVVQKLRDVVNSGQDWSKIKPTLDNLLQTLAQQVGQI